MTIAFGSKWNNNTPETNMQARKNCNAKITRAKKKKEWREQEKIAIKVKVKPKQKACFAHPY